MNKLMSGKNIRKLWYKFSRNIFSIIGLIIVIIVLFVVVFAPYIAPHPDSAKKYLNFAKAMQKPSIIHLCGTDPYGRDIFSRILFGTRISFFTAIIVLFFTVIIGIPVGLFAGYLVEKHWISDVLMRIVEIFISIPSLLLALVISSQLNLGIYNVMIALTITWWPWYARLMFNVVSSIRNEKFVLASELIGVNTWHILFKEILPNCFTTILTKFTLDVGSVIILAASISYLGLGAQPPTPDLGTMISEGAKYLPNQWWVSIFPGLAVLIIVLGFNLLGDGLHDMFRPDKK